MYKCFVIAFLLLTLGCKFHETEIEPAAESNLTASSEEDCILIIEPQPEFPGGYEALKQFLADNLHYPAALRATHVSGKVYVGFTVKADGRLDDVHILKSLHPDCDQEVIRVVKLMPRWKPGRQGGENISVRYALPVGFSVRIEN